MSIADLVQKYTPRFYFHTEEKYFPSNVDWLFQHSTLTDSGVQVPTDAESVYNLAQKYNFYCVNNVMLDFTDDLLTGQNPREVAIYCRVRETDTKIILTYIIFFPFNGNYTILRGLNYYGHHKGDIEHITVEVKKSDGSLIRVFFGAHGDADGRWVAAKDIKYEDGRILAFIALDGHGIYPNDGVYFRFFGLANDITNRGVKWDPTAIPFFDRTDSRFDKNTMWWSVYCGKIGGPDGISNLGTRGWFINADPENTNPPPGLSSLAYNVFLVFVYIIVIILVYIVVNLLFRVSHYLSGDPVSYCAKSYLEHFITLCVLVVMYFVVLYTLRYIVRYSTDKLV